MSKKVIYHTNVQETRKGRIINAFLALITANRYSVIFTFKISIVKRHIPKDPIIERAKRDLYTALVLAPFVLGIVFTSKSCDPTPSTPDINAADSISHKADTTESVPIIESVSKP